MAAYTGYATSNAGNAANVNPLAALGPTGSALSPLRRLLARRQGAQPIAGRNQTGIIDDFPLPQRPVPPGGGPGPAPEPPGDWSPPPNRMPAVQPDVWDLQPPTPPVSPPPRTPAGDYTPGPRPRQDVIAETWDVPILRQPGDIRPPFAPGNPTGGPTSENPPSPPRFQPPPLAAGGANMAGGGMNPATADWYMRQRERGIRALIERNRTPQRDYRGGMRSDQFISGNPAFNAGVNAVPGRPAAPPVPPSPPTGASQPPATPAPSAPPGSGGGNQPGQPGAVNPIGRMPTLTPGSTKPAFDTYPKQRPTLRALMNRNRIR